MLIAISSFIVDVTDAPSVGELEAVRRLLRRRQRDSANGTNKAATPS
jgi:hypothetical protein